MFKKMISTLLASAPALALVTGMGVVSAADAETVNLNKNMSVDTDAATFQISGGKGFLQFANALKKQGVTEGINAIAEKIYATNPDSIGKDRMAKRGVAYKMPAEYMSVFGQATQIAGQAPAPAPAASPTAQVVLASVSPLAPATSPKPAARPVAASMVSPLAPATSPRPMARPVGLTGGILSDEDLNKLTDNQILKRIAPAQGANSMDAMADRVAGYKIAVADAWDTNFPLKTTGEVVDYDGLMEEISADPKTRSVIVDELAKKFPAKSDAALKEMALGYAIGAGDARANDEPCDDLDRSYLKRQADFIIPTQLDVVRDMLANFGYDAYTRGLEKVDCEGACDAPAPVKPVAKKPVKTVPKPAAIMPETKPTPKKQPVPVYENCRLLQEGGKWVAEPISDKFNCGCATETFKSNLTVDWGNGEVTRIKKLWGNPDSICPKPDGDKTPKPELPTGGCQEKGGCGGGSPNGDLGGRPTTGGTKGGNTPPGPNP